MSLACSLSRLCSPCPFHSNNFGGGEKPGAKHFWLLSSDRNWRPDGGEWESIKISFEIDPPAYISKIITNPQILDEVWSSYRRAKPTQISPRNEREKIRKRSRKTVNLTVRDRSDRSLWAVRPVGLDLKFQTGCTDRSDWFLRPVRPLLPRTEFQPAKLS